MGSKEFIFGCQKLSRMAPDPEKEEGLSSSHTRHEEKRWRLRKMSRSEGQMEARGQVKNVVRRNFNIQFVSIAMPVAQKLNLIVGIAGCGSRRSSTLMKAMTRVHRRVQTNEG